MPHEPFAKPCKYLVLQLSGMSHIIPISWLFIIMHLHTNDSCSAFSGLPANLWICGFWRLSSKGDLYYSKCSDQIILVGCSELHHLLRYHQWRGIVPSQPSQPLPWNIAALQIVLRENDPELPIHPGSEKNGHHTRFCGWSFSKPRGNLTSHVSFTFTLSKSPVSWPLGAKSRFVT